MATGVAGFQSMRRAINGAPSLQIPVQAPPVPPPTQAVSPATGTGLAGLGLDPALLQAVSGYVNPATMEAQIRADAENVAAQSAARRGFSLADPAGAAIQNELASQGLQNYRAQLASMLPGLIDWQQRQQDRQLERQWALEDRQSERDWRNQQRQWAEQDRRNELAAGAGSYYPGDGSGSERRGGGGGGGGGGGTDLNAAGFNDGLPNEAGFGQPGRLLSHKTGAKLGEPFWMRNRPSATPNPGGMDGPSPSGEGRGYSAAGSPGLSTDLPLSSGFAGARAGQAFSGPMQAAKSQWSGAFQGARRGGY